MEELIATGSADAFGEIIRRYKDRLLTYTTRYLGDMHRAEDLVQETFLRVYRARRRYRLDAGARFSTYVYTICTNLVRSEGRRRPWRRVPGDGEYDAPAPMRDLSEDLVRTEQRRAIDQAVQRLKPHERSAFILRDIDGLSYEEIAAVLGCPLGTVKSRVNRARLAFREAYVELHGQPEL